MPVKQVLFDLERCFDLHAYLVWQGNEPHRGASVASATPDATLAPRWGSLPCQTRYAWRSKQRSRSNSTCLTGIVSFLVYRPRAGASVVPGFHVSLRWCEPPANQDHEEHGDKRPVMDKEKFEITEQGHERLQEELRNLIEIERPKIIEAVADARSHGDLRENSAYDAARQDQAMIEKRIADLENTLRNAVVITPDKLQGPADSIGLGSNVVVDFGGDEENFTIVGAAEARPAQGFISNASPIGRALDGRRKGDSVKAETPGGLIDLTVKSVDNSSR